MLVITDKEFESKKKVVIDSTLKRLLIDKLKSLLIDIKHIDDIGELDSCSIDMSLDGSVVAISIGQLSPSWGIANNCVYILTQSDKDWMISKRISSKHSNIDANCGSALHVNDDGTKVYIGVSKDRNEDNLITGSVYVFARTDDVWIEETILTVDSGFSNSMFGFSLAVSEDDSTLVVGAPMVNINGVPSAGAVIVYERKDNVWTKAVTLTKGLNITKNDYFGSKISISSNSNLIRVSGYRTDETVFVNIAGQWDVVSKDNLFYMNFPKAVPIITEI